MEREIFGNIQRDEPLKEVLCVRQGGLHSLCYLCWGRGASDGTVAQRQRMLEQGSSMKQEVVAERNLSTVPNLLH